jgi:hypothetical protein
MLIKEWDNRHLVDDLMLAMDLFQTTFKPNESILKIRTMRQRLVQSALVHNDGVVSQGSSQES